MQPSLGKEELDSIEKVFASNWIGKGKKVSEFEEKFAYHIGANKDNVLSVNCCTEGLFSSLILCETGKGDEVIVPSVSFVGAGNAVCASGASLVLCDVDKRTLNARVYDIEKVYTKKTKALLLLHYGGNPCDMEEIMKFAKDHNIKVIEDCAPGVSSTVNGKAIGTFGDIGMWSFDAMKILVCGDGGMLHFNNPQLRERAEKLMYFGLETKSGYENSVANKWWEFDISCYGHRAIMNDITAAIGIEQLKKIPGFMERRKEIYDTYSRELANILWMDIPAEIDGRIKISYYFYHIQIKNGMRDKLASYLREKGIYTTYRYYPLHRVKYYGITGCYPGADAAADTTLCLPIHQSLTNVEVNYIIDQIKEFGQRYC